MKITGQVMVAVSVFFIGTRECGIVGAFGAIDIEAIWPPHVTDAQWKQRPSQIQIACRTTDATFGVVHVSVSHGQLHHQACVGHLQATTARRGADAELLSASQERRRLVATADDQPRWRVRRPEPLQLGQQGPQEPWQVEAAAHGACIALVSGLVSTTHPTGVHRDRTRAQGQGSAEAYLFLS